MQTDRVCSFRSVQIVGHDLKRQHKGAMKQTEVAIHAWPKLELAMHQFGRSIERSALPGIEKPKMDIFIQMVTRMVNLIYHAVSTCYRAPYHGWVYSQSCNLQTVNVCSKGLPPSLCDRRPKLRDEASFRRSGPPSCCTRPSLSCLALRRNGFQAVSSASKPTSMLAS
jgi:hypothetical protein